MPCLQGWRGCRPLLSSTGVRSLEPGGELRHLVAMEISLTMLKNLPELLHKGRALLPEGQVRSRSAPSTILSGIFWCQTFCGSVAPVVNVFSIP